MKESKDGYLNHSQIICLFHAGTRFWVWHNWISPSAHCPQLVFFYSHLYSEQFIPHHPITTIFLTFDTLMQWIFPCARQDSAQLGSPPAFNITQRSLIKTNSLQWNTTSHKPPSDYLCSQQALRTQTQTKTCMAGQTMFLILWMCFIL